MSFFHFKASTLSPSQPVRGGVADWIRPEQDERQRSWFSLTDALGKISQWGSDLQAGDSASNEGKVAKGPAKKALKGGAMETAFRAFMESEGISPAEQP